MATFIDRTIRILAEACGNREDWSKYDHALVDVALDADVAVLRQWYTMDTASKLSEHQLFFGDGEGFMECVFVGSWDHEKGWVTAFGGRRASPTHWMPLPEIPAPSALTIG